MYSEIIDIEKIADSLGLEYYEYEGWKCIVIGYADWDGKGIETELVLKYRHGTYADEWKRTGISDDELCIMLRQTVAGTLSLSGIMTSEKAFTFIAGLLLIREDIKRWRANYMAAEYNRKLEKTLAVLK